ncbi:MAG: hypothetical protein K2R98_20610 [Gemmataceae bacterium]|nr:hypothetical protein [Gemmataceae bacterium]
MDCSSSRRSFLALILASPFFPQNGGGMPLFGRESPTRAGKQARTEKRGLEWRGHEEAIWGLAFSPGGEMLASGGQDRTVCFWDATSGKLLRELYHQKWVPRKTKTWECSPVRFSDDGKVVFGLAAAATLCRWDVQTGKEIWRESWTRSRLYGLAQSCDGRLLA